MSSHRRGILCVAGAALLWSTGGAGIKAVAAPPLTVAGVRSAVAAMALYAWFRPRTWRWSPGFVVAVVTGAVVPLHAEDAASPFDPLTARRITPAEIRHRIDAGAKPIVLDTRGVFGPTIAKGAVHVPNDAIAAWAKDVPKNALILAYCT